MKWLLSILPVLLTINLMARSYKSDMKALLDKSPTINNSDDFEKLAAEFSAIAKENPDEWLPSYYAAYHYAYAAEYSQATDRKQVQWQKAEEALTQTFDKAPENSEVWALKAFILLKEAQLSRSLEAYSEEIITAIEKAKALDPENPRVYVTEALFSLYHSNDYSKTSELAEQALKLYESYRTKRLHPEWGQEFVLGIVLKLDH